MTNYEVLSKELKERMEYETRTETYRNMRFDDRKILRRYAETEREGWYYNPFIRDIDRILHSPYFNRYADKTQV